MWWMSWCIAFAARSIATRRCSIRSGELVMSSGLLDALRRNIGLRLSLWYALIFTLSSAALFALAYYLLAAAIGSKDREVINAQLREAAAVYESAGVAALQTWARSQPQQLQQ